MAVVTFDNAALTAGPVSSNTKAVLLTVTTNAVLVVATHSNEANSMSAVVAGGVACTRLGKIVAGTGSTELWGLTAPAAGTLTISAAVTGNNPATFALAAASYVGKRTTASPFGGVVGISAAGALNANITVSSETDDMVFVAWGISANATVTLSLNQTARADATHSTTGRLVIGDATGLPLLGLSATSSGLGDWAVIGVNLLASLSVTPAISFNLCMTGCGL